MHIQPLTTPQVLNNYLYPKMINASSDWLISTYSNTCILEVQSHPYSCKRGAMVNGAPLPTSSCAELARRYKSTLLHIYHCFIPPVLKVKRKHFYLFLLTTRTLCNVHRKWTEQNSAGQTCDLLSPPPAAVSQHFSSWVYEPPPNHRSQYSSSSRPFMLRPPLLARKYTELYWGCKLTHCRAPC